MSTNVLYTSLLRPPVLHILRAAGFHATRPAVLDTLVDLTARYLSLLTSNAAAHAQENHNDLILTVTDVRMALQDVGALWPQKSAMEEYLTGEEDLRGVEAFVKWARGEENREMRRVAGLIETEAPLPDVDVPANKEDFLTGNGPISLSSIDRADPLAAALKKKHNKTGESSRFQGTVLGTPAEEKPIRIEGGPFESLQDWAANVQESSPKEDGPPSRQLSSALSSSRSSPLTPAPPA
ncbi:MAG: hypothetical protein L6R40_006022 [Gallowayella cf. fulva]|nr:MAG: hypothetical protein L6R40_006022 [Xanthomendoza cf. fulva]